MPRQAQENSRILSVKGEAVSCNCFLDWNLIAEKISLDVGELRGGLFPDNVYGNRYNHLGESNFREKQCQGNMKTYICATRAI